MTALTGNIPDWRGGELTFAGDCSRQNTEDNQSDSIYEESESWVDISARRKGGSSMRIGVNNIEDQTHLRYTTPMNRPTVNTA
jgi:hypothetical protein